jgi:hypothetical protein
LPRSAKKVEAIRVPALRVFPSEAEFDAALEKLGAKLLSAKKRELYSRYLD